jgi:hypothetical protein
LQARRFGQAAETLLGWVACNARAQRAPVARLVVVVEHAVAVFLRQLSDRADLVEARGLVSLARGYALIAFGNVLHDSSCLLRGAGL